MRAPYLLCAAFSNALARGTRTSVTGPILRATQLAWRRMDALDRQTTITTCIDDDDDEEDDDDDADSEEGPSGSPKDHSV